MHWLFIAFEVASGLAAFLVFKGFGELDLMKVWKGLFYCMWMSDKPLIQVLSCLLLLQEYVLQFGLEMILLCTVSDLPTP